MHEGFFLGNQSTFLTSNRISIASAERLRYHLLLEFCHKVFATTQVCLHDMEFLNVYVSGKCRNLFDMDVKEVLFCLRLAYKFN